MIWFVVAMVASFGAGVAFVGCLATLPKGWTLGSAVRSVVDRFDAWVEELVRVHWVDESLVDEEPPPYSPDRISVQVWSAENPAPTEWVSVMDATDGGVDYYDRGAHPGPVRHWPTEFPPGTIFGSPKDDPEPWLEGAYDERLISWLADVAALPPDMPVKIIFTPLSGEGER